MSPVETSQTLGRGLRLLELLADAPDGRTVSDLATELGVGRTVVYRLLATLEEFGLVRRDGEGRAFRRVNNCHRINRIPIHPHDVLLVQRGGDPEIPKTIHAARPLDDVGKPAVGFRADVGFRRDFDRRGRLVLCLRRRRDDSGTRESDD